MKLEKSLDAVLDEAISRERIVGAVVLVSRGGEIVYRRASGLADREHAVPMQVDAIFRLSSLTKPIIAAAILALEKNGMLTLDAPVRDLLPGFQPKLADGRRPIVTIRHLLTHTSGLSMDLPGGEDGVGESNWIDRFKDFELSFYPGTAWQYSRAHDILGVLLSAVVGEPIAEVVASLITQPLDMKDTAFHCTERSRLTAAYADDAERPVRMNDPHELVNPWGGVSVFNPDRIFDVDIFPLGSDGMAGTAGDYLKLLECIRNGGEPLDMDRTESALSDHIPHLSHSMSPGWKFSLIGARLDEPATAGTIAPVGLAAWGGVYGHAWSIDPENELSVLSMTNTSFEGSDGEFPLAIRRAIYSAL